MRFQFEPEAVEELEEAAAYLDGRSPGTGQRFLADVDSAQRLMLQFPRSGSPLRGSLRRMLLRTFPINSFTELKGTSFVFTPSHISKESQDIGAGDSETSLGHMLQRSSSANSSSANLP
jgi:hypothetical protein